MTEKRHYRNIKRLELKFCLVVALFVFGLIMAFTSPNVWTIGFIVSWSFFAYRFLKWISEPPSLTEGRTLRED
ncbi:MAG: hypothetical protein ACFBSF_16265 [Leptolyngbyaceae cyanobacterium]